uniref:Uncharacterized protein n=1 Tax=Rhizophora mucronata TaxID=61149 RepID=A0A2P2NMM7_RHIMU
MIGMLLSTRLFDLVNRFTPKSLHCLCLGPNFTSFRKILLEKMLFC